MLPTSYNTFEELIADYSGELLPVKWVERLLRFHSIDYHYEDTILCSGDEHVPLMAEEFAGWLGY